MEGDGNCLFRAVARQIYGDQEQYQKVGDETVDHLIANKTNFAEFETNIDWRLSDQRMDRSWGGSLEIAAISDLYNVGILVWELSREGELVTPFDNTQVAASKGLQNLYLSRHRRVHYNSVVSKSWKLPLGRVKVLPSNCWARDASDSLSDSLSNNSITTNQSLLPRSEDWKAKDSSSSLGKIASRVELHSKETIDKDGKHFVAACVEPKEIKSELVGTNDVSEMSIIRAQVPKPKENLSDDNWMRV